MRWARRAKTAQSLAMRARIVLACADGGTNKQVAAELGVECDGGEGGGPGSSRRGWTVWSTSRDRVGRRRSRSTRSRRWSWRPGDAPKRCHALVADVDGQAQRAEQVDDRADLEGVRPQAALQDGFKLSTDPLFVDKVVDVVGLYHNPPEHAVVLCVDEKSQIQALDRSQPVLPMMPGMPERRTHDYYRHGITSLFAAFNIADGTVISRTAPPPPRRSSSRSS